MVEKPYNILQNLELMEYGGIKAKVYNEYLDPDEGGPMGGAECGRHLAILGSIALAYGFHHKRRHYYLAVHAVLERKTSHISESNHFIAYAIPVLAEKRKGKIYGEILDEHNAVLFTAEVEYMIMSPAVFTKFYENFKLDEEIPAVESPYRNRRRLTNLVFKGDRISADYGTIVGSECEGHFKNYPALPVAVIGDLFRELGFALYKKFFPGYDKMISPRTSIRAYRLAFHGESVAFVGRISKRISRGVILVTAEAKVGDEIISSVEFEVKGVKSENHS